MKAKTDILDAKAIRRVSKEIVTMEKAIAGVEKRMLKVIDFCMEEWLSVIYKMPQRIIDIGLVTAVTCLAFMPELGTENRRKRAALAGVTPYSNSSNNSSGKYDGERHIWRGRSKVRQCLYLAVLIRKIYDQSSHDYYERQYKDKGDTKRVVIALARKFIIQTNTAVREALLAHGWPQSSHPIHSRQPDFNALYAALSRISKHPVTEGPVGPPLGALRVYKFSAVSFLKVVFHDMLEIWHWVLSCVHIKLPKNASF